MVKISSRVNKTNSLQLMCFKFVIIYTGLLFSRLEISNILLVMNNIPHIRLCSVPSHCLNQSGFIVSCFLQVSLAMSLLPDTQNCGLRMHRECRERFPRHRELVIPTCITARAWRTCRDACRDQQLAVLLEIGGEENVPGIPGACAARNFPYLVRGPWRSIFTWPLLDGAFKMAVSISVILAAFRN